MIICICNNVNDKKIIEQVKKGLNFKQIQIKLNVANDCGKCKKEIVKLIKENS